MAPFPPLILAHLQQLFKMESRGLSKDTSGIEASMTTNQRVALQILALTFSTFSVTSSALALYWFLKMRRSFRHDLIMLLIQSDMFKALWYLVYPAAVFAHGPFTDGSGFCQVSGFFVSVGVEASDFAILQIAIHSALYIFKPRIMGGEGGLYPYRHAAYFAWFFFPLLLTSLAFVNSQDAFVVEGTFCYLPVRPFWYRLALSWIPRYLIFIIILFIYVSIYYYVRYKFNGFTKTGSSSYAPNPDSVDSTDGPRKLLNRHTLPPTPTLACHGLVPESQALVNGSDVLRKSISISKQQHSSGDGNSKLRRDSATHRFMWSSFAKNTPQELLAPPSTPPSTPDAVVTSPPSPAARPVPEDAVPAVPIHAATMPLSPTTNINFAIPTPSHLRTSRQDFFARRSSPDNNSKTSNVDMLAARRRGSKNISDIPIPYIHLELVNSRNQSIEEVEMLRAREKIRRQLRFLFIYPLVYIGMWIVPFAYHIVQYNDHFAVNPPFPLACLTTIFVCSQAAVDCWLFSTREKPWRHMPGHDGTFWGSFAFRPGFWKVPKLAKVIHGPGKTRMEMNREARAAYQRRDRERAQACQRREAMDGVQQPGMAARGPLKSGGSDWWDVPGYNRYRDTDPSIGGISPVTEEVGNPMDDCVISGKAGDGEDAKSTCSGTGEQPPVFNTISFQDPKTSEILHKE